MAASRSAPAAIAGLPFLPGSPPATSAWLEGGAHCHALASQMRGLKMKCAKIAQDFAVSAG